MGRKVPSFSHRVGQEHRRGVPFRRALSAEDQAIFDRLFACIEQQVHGDVYLPRSSSFEAVILAVLLEHQKRITYLLEELNKRRS